MKKFFTLVLLLLLASAAFADTKVIDGGFFTLRGFVSPATRKGKEWVVRPVSDTSATVVPPDKSFVISVSVFDADRTALKGLAATLAQAHGARELTKMAGEGEAYEYVGASAGLPVYAQTFDLGAGKAGYIAIMGDYENWMATSAFNSISFTLPEDEAASGDVLPASTRSIKK